MTDKPINTFEDAKVALDEEIRSAEVLANMYGEDAVKATAKADSYRSLQYSLKALRARMEPPVEAPAVELREVA